MSSRWIPCFSELNLAWQPSHKGCGENRAASFFKTLSQYRILMKLTAGERRLWKRKYCFRQHCHCNPWNSGLQEALAATCFFKENSATYATVGSKSSDRKAKASRAWGVLPSKHGTEWLTGDLGGYLSLKYSGILPLGKGGNSKWSIYSFLLCIWSKPREFGSPEPQREHGAISDSFCVLKEIPSHMQLIV